MTLPQPFEFKMVADPPSEGPPPPNWAEPTRQIRDVAKWITGSIALTAGGVLAGSTLTALGSLDFDSQPVRLTLAMIGGIGSLFFLGLIFLRALEVLAPESSDLKKLAAAKSDSELGRARQKLYRMHNVDENQHPLDQLIDDYNSNDPEKKRASERYLPRFYHTQGFCVVRFRFDRLLSRMTWSVPLVVAGLGLYAWAANPPAPSPAGEVRVETAPDGKVTRTTTRPLRAAEVGDQ